MKRSLLLFGLVLLLSCKTTLKPPVTLMYDNNLEVLNGRVREITEITKKRYNADTIIIDFDIHGYITQTNPKGGCDCWIKYAYKYDKEGNPTEATEKRGLLPIVYKYNKNGRITEISQYTKELRGNSDRITKQDKFFYKYDGEGCSTECDYYVDSTRKFLVTYKHNKDHVLIEAGKLINQGYLQEKDVYKYQAFDKKGNWLKRTASVVIDHPPFETDTIERKISYYYIENSCPAIFNF